MSLSVHDAARLLGVSPDTVRRWARQGLLSVRRPTGEPQFERGELVRWANSHGLTLHEGAAPAASAAQSGGLVDALGRGCILRELGGGSKDAVLEELVRRLPGEFTLDRELLLEHLRDREALSTTGLGHGVALPHPRTPSRAFAAEPTLVLALLPEPVDWGAIDDEAVHSLLLILSPSPALHLQTLSRVAYLLRDDAFTDLLASQPGDEQILAAIAEREPART